MEESSLYQKLLQAEPAFLDVEKLEDAEFEAAEYQSRQVASAAALATKRTYRRTEVAPDSRMMLAPVVCNKRPECLVCQEAGPTVHCTRVDCGNGYHTECLPDLRKLKEAPGDWVCPPCRFKHNLGPVCALDIDHAAITGGLSETFDVAASLYRASGQFHQDVCSTCGHGGDLVLCDGRGCNRAFHPACTPDLTSLEALPEGDWFCPFCTAQQPTSGAQVLATPDAPQSGIHELGAAAMPATVAVALPAVPTEQDESPSEPDEADPSEEVAGNAQYRGHFDFALQACEGPDGWRTLVDRIREHRVTLEAKNPPKFRAITKNLHKIDKAAMRRLAISSNSLRDTDGDVCLCAQEGSQCGESCMNRLLYTECTRKNCSFGEDAGKVCRNRAMQRKSNCNVEPRPTPGKGWGLFAVEAIKKGAFIIEYCGELIDDAECERRMAEHKAKGQVHFHMLEICRDLVIDAGYMGNDARFINHSCAPNCAAEKRRVGSETRVGIYAKEDVPAGSELTYDYQFVTFAEERWECQCEEPTCRKYLGVNKREAIDAAAFAAAGVHKELKKTGVSSAEDIPDGPRPVGTTSEGFVPGKPIRGIYHMSPLNPTVLYANRRPTVRMDSVVAQLQQAGYSKREAGWVRQQRIFQIGGKAAVPNRLDDGGTTASPRSVPSTLHGDAGHSGSSGSMWSRLRTGPTPVAKAPRKRSGAVTTPPGSHRGYFAGKYRTFTLVVDNIAHHLQSAVLRKTATLNNADTAAAVENGNLSASSADSACHAIKRVWDAVCEDLAPPEQSSAAPSHHEVAVPLWSDMDFVKRVQMGLVSWASALYLRDSDLNFGFGESHTGEQDGNDVECSKCYGSGDLLCCDGCPRAFHLSCVGLSVYDVPNGRWLCAECKKAARLNRRALCGPLGVSSAAAFPHQDADSMLLFASLAPSGRQLTTAGLARVESEADIASPAKRALSGVKRDANAAAVSKAKQPPRKRKRTATKLPAQRPSVELLPPGVSLAPSAIPEVIASIAEESEQPAGWAAMASPQSVRARPARSLLEIVDTSDTTDDAPSS